MKDNDKNEKKLPDINYALMAQLSYLHWNNLKEEKLVTIDEKGTPLKTNSIKDMVLNTIILKDIKTDFYNDPSHYPKNETVDGKVGKLENYTYHEEDKRLFLVYSLDKTEKRTPFFESIINGWEYLDCATGEIIQNRFFPAELLKEYKESGFFGVAFQRGNDIIIAYRGTELSIKHNNKFIPEDAITDANIYFKETDIQQIEAVFFYEYIRTKYGPEKNIHITGHSLAGALAQYVHFYAYCSGKEVVTITWNGLGTYGSVLHKDEFFLNGISLTLFKKKINGIDEKSFLDSKERLKKFYGTSLNILKEKREKVKDIESLINYYMDEDFVAGGLNGDSIGKKVLVNVKEKTLLDRLYVNTEKIDRRTKAKIRENRIGEKLESSERFHNLNNFLVFMGDSGNLMPCVIRQEFRKNALKSVVRKRVKSYSSLISKGSEIELRKQANEPLNIYNEILHPSNRVIGKGLLIVPTSAITQKDLLFVESFEKSNNFKGYDMKVEKVDEGRYKGKIILGEYNNIGSLGGIEGREPLEIKIYIDLIEEENQDNNTIVPKKNIYERNKHGVK